MSPDDTIMIVVLVGSVLYGHVVKCIPGKMPKQLLCTLAGLAVVIYAVRPMELFHSFITITGTYLAVKIGGPRYCHVWGFLSAFGYLGLFRFLPFVGLFEPSFHCNTFQMMLTIRMACLAHEIHQAMTPGETNVSFTNRNPQLKQIGYFDFISYGYCYVGLISGPHYTFTTYYDMLEQDGRKVATILPALKKFKLFCLLCIVFFLLDYYFPTEFIQTDAFLELPKAPVYQHLYLIPSYMSFRYKFFVGWTLTDIMCITLGLGAYPFEAEARPGKGPSKPIPKDFDYEQSAKEHNGETHSFTTIHNVDVIGCEINTSMRQMIRHWNMTVAWWIHYNVFKPFPYRKLALVWTVLVVSFWHEWHPGYILTFLMLPAVSTCEMNLDQYIRPYLPLKVYLGLRWLTIYRLYDYISIGYLTKDFPMMISRWRKMYFIGHIVFITLAIVPLIVAKLFGGKKATQNKGIHGSEMKTHKE